MIYLRRIKKDNCQSFYITHHHTNKMTLVLDAGQFKDLSFDITEIEFPVLDVEQNVLFYLVDNIEEPLVAVTGRDYTDPPEVENVILTICNFRIPPSCSDLTELDIYIRCFDSEVETAFNEDGEVMWERLE